MYKFYNPNPIAARDEDCAVRAVAKALNIDWEKAFVLIATNAFLMGSMMHRDAVWGSVLRQHGFYREIIPNTCPDCYTAEQFCEEHPDGVYVLGFGGHTATVVDGILYDSWDSSGEIPIYYWYQKKE